MEKELYFKPANYGKGKKKEANRAKGGKSNRKVLKLVCLLLFLLIIVLVIIWLLHGKTTTSGQYPANVANHALTCEKDGIAHPKTEIDAEIPKHVKINMIFSGGDSLRTISLIYTTYHENYRAAEIAESWAHAAFNKNLHASGYEIDKFSNKFAIYDNELILNLYSTANGLDEFSLPYFMIENQDGSKLPKTMNEFRQIYETAGFSCSLQSEEKQ